MRNGDRGGRWEYRAIVTRTIEPQQLGLAGALPIARIDRRIGAKAKLRRTWLVTSCSERQLTRQQWLDLEQQRWGIENRTHHPLDVTHREDESRVRQPNAASALTRPEHRWGLSGAGLFRPSSPSGLQSVR